MSKKEISICWLRRDLRLDDQAALYHALKAPYPVLLLFIFDTKILDKLDNKTDPRLTFIYDSLTQLNTELQSYGSSILVKHGTPEAAWEEILKEYTIRAVFTNQDYEPYAKERDDALAEYLGSEGISFKSFKDQVIFEKEEITKADGKPYTVFTPYFRQWQQRLNDFYIKSYPVKKYLNNLLKTSLLNIPTLKAMGFERSAMRFPEQDFESKLQGYEARRDFPADDATTHIGLHLRFGTISIRHAAREALTKKADKLADGAIMARLLYDDSLAFSAHG